MKMALLELLRCPFCGGRLTLHDTGPVRGSVQRTGILCCPCCAYPMVEGLPYLRTGSTAESAMRLLGEGNAEGALRMLLGLSEDQTQPFQRLLEREQPATFRECLSFLCPGPEGDYLFHRFSDPTFRCSQFVVRALSQERRFMAGRVLDVCGGAGHLTRSLCESAKEVVLADLSFAKLWLARRFIAPRCQPICCDAGEPLPFAPGAFSFVCCSDAFHYIWRRRSLAGEMIRLLDVGGAIVLPHLHNLLGENVSAGMPLAPAGYRELFEGLKTKIFKESDLFGALLTRRRLDLSAGCADEELKEESALVLMATRAPDLFRVFECAVDGDGSNVTLRLRRNPLYAVEQESDGEIWMLRFPSAGYEFEYTNCQRYLPPEVHLSNQELDDIRQGRHEDRLSALAERCVLLDLPDGYEQW